MKKFKNLFLTALVALTFQSCNLISSDDIDSLIVLLLFLLIIGAIFLIIRGVVLWYFKVEKRFNEQKKTNKLLEDILEELKNK